MLKHSLPGPGEGPASQGAVVRRMRIAMGTWVTVAASKPDRTAPSTAPCMPMEAAAPDAIPGGGPTPQSATTAHRADASVERAIEAAFAAISAVEARMHPHRDSSDLARINHAPPSTPVLIDVSTWEVLALSKRLSELTDGVFDPCLPSKPGRMSDVELQLDAGERPIAICRTPVELDCGGIAKGFAVDRAIQALTAAGCAAGIVNAGGDLRVFGPHTETILIRLPDGQFRQLELSDRALAVSNTGSSPHNHSTQRPPEHRGYYVRTPAPVCARTFAAVLAREAIVADALTKCMLLCPPSLTDNLQREFDAHCVFLA